MNDKSASCRRPFRRLRQKSPRKGAAQPTRAKLIFLGASALSIAFACGANVQAASKLDVLYSFRKIRGSLPNGVIAGASGNLYGTAGSGGADNAGDVFELTPPTDGKKAWKETVLFSFDISNGAGPGDLTLDASGNIYGMACCGGTRRSGGIFELSPPPKGQTIWTEKTLFLFSGTNGAEPEGGLIADGNGDLFGTTAFGGAHKDGTVFELTPPVGGGAWTETVLHSFNFRDNDGENPSAGLLADRAGNLYGTTFGSGERGYGIVFELSPPKAGKTAWTESVLFNFNGTNGQYPGGTLIADEAGNLYGTTFEGGANNDGVVFELSPPAPGSTTWTETVLLSFNVTDGSQPSGPLLADATGNLYGTTHQGGAGGGGVVFELSPPAQGSTIWTETVLQSFTGPNGYRVQGGLLSDGSGNFYGTTASGGRHDDGVVFKLKH